MVAHRLWGMVITEICFAFISFKFFKFLQNACFFYFLTIHTQKQTHTGTYNTQQTHLSVKNWTIVDKGTKILNSIPYISSTSDKISKITLKCELDLTIFVQILEVSSQFRNNTVHIVTALIGLYLISAILVTILFCLFFVYFLFSH